MPKTSNIFSKKKRAASGARRKRPTKGSYYRSKFEKAVADNAVLDSLKGITYEADTIEYVWPERKAKYTPDFRLPNGIYVEAKGILDLETRKKHRLLQEQHPDKDIRFVFMRNSRLYKGSKTTYTDWCDKNGFKWAIKKIPEEWYHE